jgi:hypothetical protein
MKPTLQLESRHWIYKLTKWPSANITTTRASATTIITMIRVLGRVLTGIMPSLSPEP